MDKIKESVGADGKNKPDDVMVIQTLVNKVEGTKFVVNGVCGDDLIEAIKTFQSGFLSKPDGKIDPGGTTFSRLVKYAKLGFVLLPQGSGMGYYSYSEFAKQYGTPDAIKTLQDVAQTFSAAKLKDIAIGDISYRNGAHMDPHESHRSGKNIDIRPIRTDSEHRGVTIDDAEYSQDDTRFLAETLLAHTNVRKILFNDRKIKGVTFYKGHHNHLHVETHS